MIGITALAWATLALAQQATDTTVALDGATRLRMDVPGGSVAINTWDRPTVHIVAEHSTRTVVDVRRRGTTLTIDSEARRGPGVGIVDYKITIPASLDVTVEGSYVTVTIEGANGAVQVETMDGDILIRGGRGTVKASSVNGTVDVEGSAGRVDVSTVAQGLRVADATGEVYAESVGGAIVLENLRATVVEAGNVGGGIRFSGTLAAGGIYSFGTHGGPISIQVPATAAATFNVATIHGAITSDLPGAPARFEQGKRLSFTTGAGGATVEAETFAGRISIARNPGG
jgi:DUF4097 and DUF4098 domain-containing protein YvlB